MQHFQQVRTLFEEQVVDGFRGDEPTQTAGYRGPDAQESDHVGAVRVEGECRGTLVTPLDGTGDVRAAVLDPAEQVRLAALGDRAAQQEPEEPVGLLGFPRVLGVHGEVLDDGEAGAAGESVAQIGGELLGQAQALGAGSGEIQPGARGQRGPCGTGQLRRDRGCHGHAPLLFVVGQGGSQPTIAYQNSRPVRR